MRFSFLSKDISTCGLGRSWFVPPTLSLVIDSSMSWHTTANKLNLHITKHLKQLNLIFSLWEVIFFLSLSPSFYSMILAVDNNLEDRHKGCTFTHIPSLGLCIGHHKCIFFYTYNYMGCLKSDYMITLVHVPSMWCKYLPTGMKSGQFPTVITGHSIVFVVSIRHKHINMGSVVTSALQIWMF